jgi:hypothetical protein
MKSDKIDQRKDIADSVRSQNEKLPVCPYDRKPCNTPETGCEVNFFGVLGDDVRKCHRLRK